MLVSGSGYNLFPRSQIKTSYYQVDAAPAAGRWELVEGIVGHVECVQAAKVVEGVRESPKVIVGELQLLKLLT